MIRFGCDLNLTHFLIQNVNFVNHIVDNSDSHMVCNSDLDVIWISLIIFDFFCDFILAHNSKSSKKIGKQSKQSCPKVLVFGQLHINRDALYLNYNI